MITVRPATAADVPRLAEIFRAAAWSNVGDRPLFDEHPEYLEWSGDPAREGRGVLAEVDGVIAGFASTRALDGAVDVEDLFVDPVWMRRGIATALMNEVFRLAGAARVVVDANPHALAFYERAGFEVDPAAEPRDGIAMRRRQHS